ncbi:hypothetical protein [Haloparvum sedimenti]|uniref:hypothetical protein n=1 Tax=Haloparvum sedimenti TaxID=1678448 RepID=UPI00071E8D06|nr:hypothetical protein [Haloparvum sedimenti]
MTEVLEFGTRADANSVRDDHAEHLTGRFDRRFAKAELEDDVPDDVEAEIRGIAADGRADRATGAGQVELTDAEKDRLGPFTGSNNYRKAAAVKGAYLGAGIDDWGAYYDPELTADENIGRIEEVRQQQAGADVRDGPTEQEMLDKEADAAARVDDEECDHARNKCKNGAPGACEHLQHECGISETEVTTLLDHTEQVPFEYVDGTTKGALSRAWDGYTAAVRSLSGLLDDLEREFQHAERAAEAINAIEQGISDAETERFDALEGHHRALLNLYNRHDHTDHGQPGHGRDPTDDELQERAPDPPEPRKPDALTNDSTRKPRLDVDTTQLQVDDGHPTEINGWTKIKATDDHVRYSRYFGDREWKIFLDRGDTPSDFRIKIGATVVHKNGTSDPEDKLSERTALEKATKLANEELERQYDRTRLHHQDWYTPMPPTREADFDRLNPGERYLDGDRAPFEALGVTLEPSDRVRISFRGEDYEGPVLSSTAEAFIFDSGSLGRLKVDQRRTVHEKMSGQYLPGGQLDAIERVQRFADNRHVEDSDGGLAEFGVEATTGADGPSEEHRRAQNQGYLRGGSRGFAEDASARDGLGQFAATGGEETLDTYENDD